MSSDDPTTPHAPVSGAAVFVDSSGQRATLIRRAAAVIVLICLAYGATLLIAAMTGVPIKGAILPYPALGSTTHVSHSGKTPGHTPTVPTAGGSAGGNSGTSSTNSSPTTGTHNRAKATKSAHSTHAATPTSGGTPSAAATTPAAAATKSRGNSTSAPGATNRPTSHPTKTSTTHGHSGKA